MKFARVIFAVVGAAGIAAVFVRLPAAEEWSDVALSMTLLAWQIVFLIIALDPVRYRPVMIPAALEKLLYVMTVLGLAATGRIPEQDSFIAEAIVHGSFGVLFVIAYVKTPRPWSASEKLSSLDRSASNSADTPGELRR